MMIQMPCQILLMLICSCVETSLCSEPVECVVPEYDYNDLTECDITTSTLKCKAPAGTVCCRPEEVPAEVCSISEGFM